MLLQKLVRQHLHVLNCYMHTKFTYSELTFCYLTVIKQLKKEMPYFPSNLQERIETNVIQNEANQQCWVVS